MKCFVNVFHYGAGYVKLSALQYDLGSGCFLDYSSSELLSRFLFCLKNVLNYFDLFLELFSLYSPWNIEYGDAQLCYFACVIRDYSCTKLVLTLKDPGGLFKL